MWQDILLGIDQTISFLNDFLIQILVTIEGVDDLLAPIETEFTLLKGVLMELVGHV